jgi:alpha-mannosidase
MPLQILGRTERVTLTESPRDYPDADLVVEARAVGWIDRMPGYAVVTRSQEATRGAVSLRREDAVRVEDGALDNGLLRVEIDADGSVRVRDLVSGRVIEHAITLEDASDAGDLYTPAIRESRDLPAAHRVRVMHRGPLRGQIVIARRWRSGVSGAPTNRCEVSVVLDAGSPFLRLQVVGMNASTNHRLRIRFSTGLEGARTIADAAFHLVERGIPVVTPEDAAMEHVVRTAPLHRYVSRYGDFAGATIYSDGLAEYESLADGTVAISLVRAVGALSRHDLPERPGHAGWPAETPLAQSLGPYHASFALAMHGPDNPEQRDDVERMADDVLLPLVGRTLRSNLLESHAVGGLELIGAGLAFSAAMPAREPGWVVLRCVNRRDAEVHGAWRAARPIAEASLARIDETPLSALAVEHDVVRFSAPSRAVVTVLVRWGDAP